MRVQRWRFGPDYVGTFTGATLDYTQYASTYNHPAVVPNASTTGGTVYTGAQIQAGSLSPTYSSSANWSVVGSVLYTQTAGEYVEVTTTARQVLLQLTGILAANMGAGAADTNAISNVVHNGALARVYLDYGRAGQRLLQTVDTYGGAPTLSPIALDGATHYIRVVHTGLVGNGSSSAPESMIGVLALTSSTSASVGAGTFTSQVLNSGNQVTQWYVAEWAQGSRMANFTLQVGATPSPDSTWTTLSVTPSDLLDLHGNRIGYGQAGLMAAGRGQYAVWSLTFPSNVNTPLWFSDFALYSWIPDQDWHFLAKVPLGRSLTGSPAVPGPVLSAVTGALASIDADGYAAALDFVASYSMNGAVDQFLYTYASDAALIPAVGEPQQSLATRLTTPVELRPVAGSLAALAQQGASLLYGTPGPITTTATSASCSGVVVTRTGANAVTITIPPSPWSALPTTSTAQTATAQVTILRFFSDNTPVGTTVTISPNPPL